MPRTSVLIAIAIVIATANSPSAGAVSASASSRSTPKRVAQPSAPSIGALPVVSCATSYAVGSPPSPFVARELPSTGSTRSQSFYSNGLITVLAPRGWACGALVAADGGQKLDVYPSGKPDYSTALAPKGAELVEVQREYTGHLPGAEVVCGLFPNSAAAAEAEQSGLPKEPCQSPAGEKRVQLTPDVVAFTDPPGVSGSGSGSGGALPTMGVAVYPQLALGSSDSVTVWLLSCTLPARDASLCRAVEADFVVRDAPSYVPQAS